MVLSLDPVDGGAEEDVVGVAGAGGATPRGIYGSAPSLSDDGGVQHVIETVLEN